jgi:hypothetical protein
MKVQVRSGVFETNSSSTHALSIFSKEQLDLFDKGELYVHGYNLEISTKEEVDKQWEAYQKRNNGNSRYSDKEEFRKEYLCAFTADEFGEFCEDYGYETLWETSPDDKWTAVSLWGDRS